MLACRRSLRFSVIFCSISLRLFSECLADGSSSSGSKNGSRARSMHSSASATGPKILIICLGLAAVVAFSVFLFRIWEKKKREEQHAHYLLKFFVDDDELEVELGIRD